MRYTSDDFDQVSGENLTIPNYPVEIELMGFMQDPLIAAEIEGIIDEAELMGLDINDPELMGGLIKTLVKKIQGAIKRRRARKKAASAPAEIPSFSLQTPGGTAAIGPGGISWTGPQAAQAAAAAQAAGLQMVPASSVQPAGTGGVTEMLKNPIVIAGLVGVPLLLIMMKRRG